MSISITSPTNGSNVGCVIDLRVICSTRNFTITITYNNYLANCKPGSGTTTTKPQKRGVRRFAADAAADTTMTAEMLVADGKQRPPRNRNGNYREFISLCDFMGQGQLCRGNSITITVTDDNGNTASATVTLQPRGANNGKRCDCPGNQ